MERVCHELSRYSSVTFSQRAIFHYRCGTRAFPPLPPPPPPLKTWNFEFYDELGRMQISHPSKKLKSSRSERILDSYLLQEYSSYSFPLTKVKTALGQKIKDICNYFLANNVLRYLIFFRYWERKYHLLQEFDVVFWLIHFFLKFHKLKR